MLIFLIVSTPFTIAQSEIGKEETGGFLSVDIPKDDFGEGQITDINIFVNRYEPTVLVSSLLEDQNVPIYAFLSATPTSGLELPRIQSVRITEIAGNRSFQAGVKHVQPKVWSWEDIGYLELRLKRISKEHKVPEKITLDLKARIEYEADVTSGLIGGAQTKILNETPIRSLQNVIFDPDADIFGGKGHIVLRQVSGNSASFNIYDSEGKYITTVSASLGRESPVVNLVPGTNIDENLVRIRLNKIIDTSRPNAVVTIKGLDHTLVRGTEILDWRVEGFCGEEPAPYVQLNKIGSGGGTARLYKDIIGGENGGDDNIERDWGEFTVKKINKAVKPRAVFSVGAQAEPKKVEVGQDIGDGSSDCTRIITPPEKNVCRLESIQSGGVIVSYPDKVLGKDECERRTKALRIRNLDTRLLSEETLLPVEDFSDVVESRFCSGGIRLEDVETGRSVQVTILSGKRRAVTETEFTLNIPIEKRSIQLSPRSISKKINSTQELIDKLTGTINRLESVVESWTKICLATTAIFTIYNFFTYKAPPEKPEEKKEVITGSNLLESIGVKDKQYSTSPNGCTQKGGFVKLGEYTDSLQNGRQIYVEEKGTPHSYFVEKDVNGKIECIPSTNTVIYDEKQNAVQYFNGGLVPVKGLREDQLGDVSITKEDGKSIIIVPIKSEAQLFRLSNTMRRQYTESWKTEHGDIASNGYYLKYKEGEHIEVRRGYGKIDQFSDEIDDQLVGFYSKSGDSQRDFIEIESKIAKPINEAQKRGDSEVDIFGAKYKLDTTKKIRTEVKCEDVLGPEQCKIMYNACDPVMCPASRCDLGGKYDVPDDNVIQTGLIGSIVLCAPNSALAGGDVVVPFCLSGILASLKNIRSYLEGYKLCLVRAQVDDEAIGVCDKFRSIFMCQIIWKEAITIFNLRGGLINTYGKKIPGIGNLLDYSAPRLEQVKKTTDFFTKSYATSIFASYRGKTTEQIGAEVCKSAVGGAMPNLGEFAGEIAKPEDPPQFTAYFEEHDYSPTLGESRYNVYYHIYAGTPRGTSIQALNYDVFLRSQGLSDLRIRRGNLRSGEFADESRDITGQRGYQEICISLNGKVQCGLGKTVSTSFGITKLADHYFAENLLSKITKAEQCVPSQQSGLATYGAGLIPTASVDRVCSINNPYRGLGEKKEKEWFIVGECGSEKGSLGNCWEHANLENYPSVQAKVFEESCTENQNAKLCKAGESCINGVVLRDFLIKYVEDGDIKSENRKCCSGANAECKAAEGATTAGAGGGAVAGGASIIPTGGGIAGLKSSYIIKYNYTYSGGEQDIYLRFDENNNWQFSDVESTFSETETNYYKLSESYPTNPFFEILLDELNQNNNWNSGVNKIYSYKLLQNQKERNDAVYYKNTENKYEFLVNENDFLNKAKGTLTF